jgi:hypothetical protein
MRGERAASGPGGCVPSRPPSEVCYVPVDEEGREVTDMGHVADGS